MPILSVGDPAPWFTTVASRAPEQELGQDFIMGGYRAVLFFFGSSSNPLVRTALLDFCAMQPLFVRLKIHFFGISIDPNDRALQDQVPASSYFHWLWDFTGEISVRYGLCDLGEGETGFTYDPTTFVLSENLRVLKIVPLETHISHAAQIAYCLESLPVPLPPRLITQQAPVLLIPNVFQPEFCQSLIAGYEQNGGQDSGFMRQDGNQTVVVTDSTVKRRRDWLVTDLSLLKQINQLVGRRILGEVERAYQFRVTCFERYVVACYESAQQGFFQPHRDNRATGTAHRRFAMTLNLNTGYEGGCLRFSEYGNDLYAPTTGSAVVFSCSLLHEATPVTSGRRFALLSFFYSDEEAKLRQQTQSHIVRTGSTVLGGEQKAIT